MVAISQDAGATWTYQGSAGVYASHIAVGPLEPDGKRRVYAEGYNTIWCSTDGGATWTQDSSTTITDARQALHDFQNACLGGVGGLGGLLEWPGLPGAYARLAAVFDRVAVSDIARARTRRWRAQLASLWPGIADVKRVRVSGTAAQSSSAWS